MGMLELSQGPSRPTLFLPGLVELTKISDDLILSESDLQLTSPLLACSDRGSFANPHFGEFQFLGFLYRYSTYGLPLNGQVVCCTSQNSSSYKCKNHIGRQQGSNHRTSVEFPICALRSAIDKRLISILIKTHFFVFGENIKNCQIQLFHINIKQNQNQKMLLLRTWRICNFAIFLDRLGPSLQYNLHHIFKFAYITYITDYQIEDNTASYIAF